MSVEKLPPSRTLKEYLGLSARGFAMGCADVVPGVSGGTMAFILGIYEELIDSIRAFTMPDNIKMLLGFEFKKAFMVMPWRFLLAVALGILTAIVSMAKMLEWALHNYPEFVWAFFFGLVIASIITVRTRVKQWSIPVLVSLVVGTIVAFLIVTLVPLQTPDAPWFLFLSGAIAICAMILPGISGSFLLVILGKYQFILAAVNNRDILTLFWVAAGAGIGIVSFAQVVGWLFKRYHDLTISFLIGLMIGSLWKIWPWKVVLETYTKPDGEIIPLVEQNVLPALNGDLFIAIIFGIIGFGLVFILDRWANQPISEPTEEARATIAQQSVER